MFGRVDVGLEADSLCHLIYMNFSSSAETCIRGWREDEEEDEEEIATEKEVNTAEIRDFYGFCFCLVHLQQSFQIHFNIT